MSSIDVDVGGWYFLDVKLAILNLGIGFKTSVTFFDWTCNPPSDF